MLLHVSSINNVTNSCVDFLVTVEITLMNCLSVNFIICGVHIVAELSHLNVVTHYHDVNMLYCDVKGAVRMTDVTMTTCLFTMNSFLDINITIYYKRMQSLLKTKFYTRNKHNINKTTKIEQKVRR